MLTTLAVLHSSIYLVAQRQSTPVAGMMSFWNMIHGVLVTGNQPAQSFRPEDVLNSMIQPLIY